MPRRSTILLSLLALSTALFTAYSAALGLQALTSGATHRVFAAGTPLSNATLALHMITGGLLTLAAPLQPLTRHRRTLHRRFGYILFALALTTGVGGLIYIAGSGTIGGVWMSLWFALYGIALIYTASQTLYAALNKDLVNHKRWATHFIILCLGSWLFRLHYTLWYAATDGWGSNEGLIGPFDRIQVVAFFVPYVLIAEWVMNRRAR